MNITATPRLTDTVVVCATDVQGQDVLHTADGAVQVETVVYDVACQLVTVTALTLASGQWVEYLTWDDETYVVWEG